MKVLITGGMGFTGRHLIEHLRKKGETEVFSTDIPVVSQRNYYTCDLTDYQEVAGLITKIRPDQIYHLAGTFSNDYDLDYRSNVLTTRMLLDAVVSYKLQCKLLLVGSSAEYGLVSESDNPVQETHTLAPVSIYGLTKVYQTYLMRYYCQSRGVYAVMARPFNLMGEGMAERLFIGRIYKQISDYKEGKADKIRVGNLEARRDYIDVSQAVEYYELIMRFGTAGEIYNVGMGHSVRMRDLLHTILLQNDLDMSVVEEVQISTSNKIDVPVIYADITKLERLKFQNSL